MKRNQHERRGFATWTAMVMLGLLAVVVVVVSESFRVQVSRTRIERIDAQLRQMLLAGTDKLLRLDAANVDPSKMRLPVPGEPESSITIELRSMTATGGEAYITATQEGRVATEHLQLTRSANRWQISQIDQLDFTTR